MPRRKRREGRSLHPGVTLLEPDGATRIYYVLRWRDAAGKVHTKTTGLTSKGEARKVAIAKSEEIREPDYDADLTWVDFTARYEAEELADAPKKTRAHWATSRGWYANLMEPKFMDEVNSSAVSRFVPRLRAALMDKNKRAPASTISSYLKELLAAFSWAHNIGLMRKPVKVKLPRKARKGGKFARSRAVTDAEFREILENTKTVRPNDWPQWHYLLKGYWHSGFRLRELLDLSWDDSASAVILPPAPPVGFPLVRFTSEGHKRGEDQYQLITPEFWALINEEPPVGQPFMMLNRKMEPCDPDWVGKVIAKCGKSVTTGIGNPKTATCHDIGKRAWTTRLAGDLSQADLAEIARHRSPQTTADYYRTPQLEALAEKLGWKKEE